ncbi:MAG TPA: tetratricopeptide repeat protein [Candidatus Limnocylindria bacterium]|jgi:tetratricopeptide (TPR) repeat protein|nr:tetratricopeptide repeat protein [Candidatus Limnocylindria bacterium]
MQQSNRGWAYHLNLWGMPLLLLALVLACYWPALHGGILWDDPAHIPRRDLRSWSGLWRIWTDVKSTQQYYPVLFSAFWVEYRLWGDQTLGYHLVNVALHTTSCCLLAWLLRRLWQSRIELRPTAVAISPAGAWFAAALFAVHPVCVESVAWMTEQKNALSLVFYLAAALVYLDFDRNRRPSRYALATVLFLFALGAKTVTVTLPVSLLVVLWWRWGGLRWRRDVMPLAPWFAFSLVSGLLTSWLERHVIGADLVVFDLSIVQRVLLAGRVLWFYVGKLVWPVDLNFFYPKWDVPAEASNWAAYVVAGLAVTIGLWLLRRRWPGLLAAWLVYVAGLFPILGFFKVFFFGFTYVNDHFQYLPALAPLAAVGGAVGLVLAHPRRSLRVAVVGLAVTVVGLLAVGANRQSRNYRSNEELARSVLARNPSSWIARAILASTLAKLPDRHEEALAEFQAAIRLNPDYPEAHIGLGVELARLPGRRDDAIAEYQRAIALRFDQPEAHHNLGLELARTPGRTADAIAEFETALRIKPDYEMAHANLADVYARFPEHVPEAMAHYHEALRLNPGLLWVRCRLAFLLSRLPGKQDEALAEYRTVLQIDPDYIDAHNGLGLLYAMTGRVVDARREWETVLRLDPSMESARRNLRRLDEMRAP